MAARVLPEFLFFTMELLPFSSGFYVQKCDVLQCIVPLFKIITCVRHLATTRFFFPALNLHAPQAFFTQEAINGIVDATFGEQ